MGEGIGINSAGAEDLVTRALKLRDGPNFEMTFDVGLLDNDENAFNNANWLALDVLQRNIVKFTENNSFGMNFKVGKLSLFKNGGTNESSHLMGAVGVVHEYLITAKAIPPLNFVSGSWRSSVEAVLNGGCIMSSGVQARINWLSFSGSGIVGVFDNQGKRNDAFGLGLEFQIGVNW